MGLAGVRRVGGRAIRAIPECGLDRCRDASASGLPRPFGTRYLSQLYGELRSTGAGLSGCRFDIPERTGALRGEFQLSAFSALTLGGPNEKDDFAAVAFGIGRCRIGRNQIDRHHDFWDGLRGVCTRRARVSEGCLWRRYGRRESGERAGGGENETREQCISKADERCDREEWFHDEAI